MNENVFEEISIEVNITEETINKLWEFCNVTYCKFCPFCEDRNGMKNCTIEVPYTWEYKVIKKEIHDERDY